MAITLVSSNLNQWGDNGNFNTDPSTWGFGQSLPIVNREILDVTKIYSGFGSNRAILPLSQPTPAYFFVTRAKATLQGGKKYVCYARVRNENTFGGWFGGSGDTFSIEPIAGTPNILSLNKLVTVDAVTARGIWSQLETRFNTDVFSGSQDVTFDVVIRDSLGNIISQAGGPSYAWADEFFIYEYQDVVPPACTIGINVAGSTITPSTGSNGSITIAVTGGTAPFEYSKDNGATWQSSNVFAGLAVGIYQCKVREVTNPTCVASYPFSVPATSYTFSFTTNKTDETIAGANNGTIDVTVTGTVAPFTFSKDGGATFVSGNVFTGLAPGVYTIVVKDNGGVQRATNVTINAGTVIFSKAFLSKNPVAISFLAPSNWQSLTNYRMYLEVNVEDVPGTSVFNTKDVQELYPDAGGICQFNIGPALRSVFALTPPNSQEASIKKLTDRSRLFKLKRGTLTNYDTVPASFTETTPYLAVYGGLDAFAFASFDFFDRLNTSKQFLTWAPNDKAVNFGQEDYLNFYVYGASFVQLKLQVKAYFDDGTNATAITKTSACVYGSIYQIPAGPQNSGAAAINPAKTLSKYEVSLLNQSDSLISEVRTYTVNAVTHPLTRYILFVNSLGTHEVHALKGVKNAESSVEKEMVQRYLPLSYAPMRGQFAVGDATLSKKYSMSTGLFEGPLADDWVDYFTDLLLTNFCYDVTNATRKPILILPGSISQEDRDYSNLFVRFEAMDAYEHKAYTPDL